jgi:hypothetical protein
MAMMNVLKYLTGFDILDEPRTGGSVDESEIKLDFEEL